ncbi:tryptophan--tRNA ligase [Spiroplasma platyhelix]|uniref:Tryptophan--tRNA ligase n=1 Tax=Spiroplasma platyhelix PALS-1 TaxID=1276218 RepID=A0A846TPX3_9MOLU|nr:tryptophan--tRNA ligase [Spiroplasma platyhelix]MBE4703967.1 Tryptophan--tRNA ligase [Spiroplasma platyhelix PALS-1]NKE38340.1 tryptophan--tRNA ligase [Spiroplasma platyhelix PALS-1]UJB29225.1 tryptophanyl-tRNA synthetase [Spiroplasma platyhelix PALS-1]
MKKRVLSGVTSTGKLTLGNYLGAISNFVKLQTENELFIFIANLHAITIPIAKKELATNTLEIAAWYFACGIDPNVANVFVQSDVLEHTQLSYILLCNSYLGELERMTQFKDKMQKTKQQNKTISIPTGLLVYPTLMAADILLYEPDLVPVGSDQTQHLELTKTLAERLNAKYQANLFKIPQQYQAQHSHRIMSLQDPTKKMSKSDDNPKNVIFLSDDLNTITEKIKKAVTDSENIIKYDIEKKPGVSNLLAIYASITNKTIAEAESYFASKDYSFLKTEIITTIHNLLAPIQEKQQKYLSDQASLIKLLQQGAENAKKIAASKLQEVQKAIGINYQ